MFSYLFSAKKATEASVPVLEKDLAAENEQLKKQIESLLRENENLKRDSQVYRDLMYTKMCNCCK